MNLPKLTALLESISIIIERDGATPINWNDHDIQINGVWDENSVAEFYGKPVDRVEREEIDLSDLNPSLAENDGIEEMGRVVSNFGTIHWGWYTGENIKKLESKIKDLNNVSAFSWELEQLSDILDEYHSLIETYNEISDDPEEMEYWDESEVEEMEDRIQEQARELMETESGGYDWSEYDIGFHKGVPPIVVVDTVDGYDILDGNHRITYAQNEGYTTIGAWVVYPTR